MPSVCHFRPILSELIGAATESADVNRERALICGSCPPAPRDNKIHFHQATKDRRISLIPGIHYFDAHRLQLLLLQAPTLQIHLRASPLAGPEGAGETVEDPSSG